ncbi:MAG: hypothetical protein PHW18_11120 [Sulfuricurvum sp.]|uniref:hypothetical protein n=1 Tax=Sulfuricurvum sp. TaxID=2025608 RepID=UPI00260EC4C2|nr:hypothetical protein [Sulfuricurvum sp.]MDD2830115.1 hypothetical protein [Sulfuricurvum sp.]MDD4949621.1 hypothetical protein [Sulfuricurvum sp.]
MNTILAKTFTPFYSESEDRIRLVVNYADYENRFDLWLTRAFLLKLLPTIEECLDQYGTGAELVQLQQSNANVETKTDSSTLSITEKKGHLVYSVDLTFKPTNNTFEIVFKTDEAHVISTLNELLLKTVLKSIFNSMPLISWGISSQLIR